MLYLPLDGGGRFLERFIFRAMGHDGHATLESRLGGRNPPQSPFYKGGGNSFLS